MNIVLYDGSFEGLLTAVFEIYEFRIIQPVISRVGEANGSLFGTTHTVQTDRAKSERVYKALRDKISLNGLSRLYKTFLSELKDIENVLFRYMQHVISSAEAVENNYTNRDILMVLQTSKKVDREKHRMEAFVRFQLTSDQLYYSIIQPDYNVLPLIRKHFEVRYADQRWLIYDALRRYGLYYDGKTVEEVVIDFSADFNSDINTKTLYGNQEELYQQLWQQYFSSINIAARKNVKLHIRHMPKRYWRYLVEKKI